MDSRLQREKNQHPSGLKQAGLSVGVLHLDSWSFGAIPQLQTLVGFSATSQAWERFRTMMSKLTDYVKTAEAAEFLGVSQNTLRKWAEAGQVPMHRNPANGYRLFRRVDLEQFLRRAAQPTKPQRPRKAR
jgi:excisionase family DNA binding protein